MKLVVSIITVCYNSEKTIQHAIESVLAQDYKSIEYIIVDGDSADDTMTVVRSYADRIDQVISEPDNGIYEAMNKGISVSSGDIIGILNSDDIYTSRQEISAVVEKFQTSPKSSIIFGDVVFKNFTTGKVVRYYSGRRFRPFKLRFGWMPPHPASFVRKKIYDQYGGYPTSYAISADYERFVKWLLVEKIEYRYIPRVVVAMRVGGVSTSGLRSVITLNKEILRALKCHGVSSNWLFLLVKVPFKLLEYFKRS